MRGARFPVSYEECRTRFRMACAEAGCPVEPHPITARGPHGLELSIDVAQLGAASPDRALLVMAGVHGVEGLATSPIMCDAVTRWQARDLPDDVGIVLVHAVNPWGMAWWRRQNESNVDLNRNWGVEPTEQGDPTASNPGYAVVHPLLCPDTDEPPSTDSFLERSRELIDEHGYEWVRAAVSNGQSTHPDGLYFTGDRIEASTAIVGSIVTERLGGARDVVVVDLHTGYGGDGDMTLLARVPAGSDGDRWTRDRFPGFAVVNTASADDDAPRRGQIATGLSELVPHATWRAVTAELGTRSETTMILAERAEHWVHRHGDRSVPAHAAIVHHHLRCSTPDDPDWERAASTRGAEVLDAALAAVVG